MLAKKKVRKYPPFSRTSIYMITRDHNMSSHMKNIRHQMVNVLGEEMELKLYNTHSLPVKYCYCAKLLLQDKSIYDRILLSAEMFDLSLLDKNNPWGQFTHTAAEAMHLDEEPSSGGESLIKCRKCGFNANFSQSQTRSGDEAMTVFIECKNPACRASYRL
jgi:DNA-directed RNA polymerase subunit M/transcription elongation factor TFIIS